LRKSPQEQTSMGKEWFSPGALQGVRQHDLRRFFNSFHLAGRQAMSASARCKTVHFALSTLTLFTVSKK
jgi:hypothetical protein